MKCQRIIFHAHKEEKKLLTNIFHSSSLIKVAIQWKLWIEWRHFPRENINESQEKLRVISQVFRKCGCEWREKMLLICHQNRLTFVALKALFSLFFHFVKVILWKMFWNWKGTFGRRGGEGEVLLPWARTCAVGSTRDLLSSRNFHVYFVLTLERSTTARIFREKFSFNFHGNCKTIWHFQTFFCVSKQEKSFQEKFLAFKFVLSAENSFFFKFFLFLRKQKQKRAKIAKEK